MTVFHQLSNDQIALFGCALALLACLGTLSVAPYVKQFVGNLFKTRAKTAPRTHYKSRETAFRKTQSNVSA